VVVELVKFGCLVNFRLVLDESVQICTHPILVGHAFIFITQPSKDIVGATKAPSD
jgi:hypothetical protein